MTVLSKKFPGFLKVCEECGAVLAYVPADIYENRFIYCPICRYKMEIPLQ